MVSRFLAIVLVAGACILPPPVAVDDIPNQQPYISPNATIPAKASITLNLLCQSCTFSLQVDDPDTSDSLYARWFLDYDLGNTQDLAACEKDVAPPAAGAAQRSPLECVFSLQENPLDEGTVHTVEAWVSDRPFADSGLPTRRALTTTDANVTVRQWTVTVATRGLTCDNIEQMQCVAASAR